MFIGCKAGKNSGKLFVKSIIIDLNNHNRNQKKNFNKKSIINRLNLFFMSFNFMSFKKIKYIKYIKYEQLFRFNFDFIVNFFLFLFLFIYYMSIKLTDLPNKCDTFFEKDEIYLFLIRQEKNNI